MIENQSENVQFNTIFDNQEESVIIINKEKQIIEYVNKSFYETFHEPINSMITKEINTD